MKKLIPIGRTLTFDDANGVEQNVEVYYDPTTNAYLGIDGTYFDFGLGSNDTIFNPFHGSRMLLPSVNEMVEAEKRSADPRPCPGWAIFQLDNDGLEYEIQACQGGDDEEGNCGTPFVRDGGAYDGEATAEVVKRAREALRDLRRGRVETAEGFLRDLLAGPGEE